MFNKIKKLTIAAFIFALPAAALAEISINDLIDTVIEEESVNVSCEYNYDVFTKSNYVKEPRSFTITLNRRPLKDDGLSSLLLNGGISVKTKSFGNFVINDFEANTQGDLVNIFNRVGSAGQILTVSGNPLSIKIVKFRAAQPGTSGPSNSSGLGTPAKPEVNRVDYTSGECTLL